MTSIDVVPHGDRWAVRVDGDTRSEHLTQAEAESAARRIGGSGAGVAVAAEDPTGLAGAQSPVDPAPAEPTPRAEVQPGERTRKLQQGL